MSKETRAGTQRMGARLREKRRTQRGTLRVFAEWIGISESYLSLIERGLRMPSLEKLRAIAGVYEIDRAALLDLLEGTGE